MFREQGGTPRKTIDELRKELEAKRKENLAAESSQHDEAGELERDIAIEDKRKEAYSKGLLESQLLTVGFPGIGRCLFRTPQDLVYRAWAKKSGVLKGDLVNDPVVHDELVSKCILEPNYEQFSELARNRCPHAPVQLAGVIIERMKGKAETEGK